VVDRPVKSKPAASAPKATAKPSPKMFSQPPKEAVEEENPWLVQTERTNRRRTGTDAQESMDITIDDEQPQAPQAPASSKKSKVAKAAPAKKRSRDEQDSDEEENVPVLLKNHDLVARAFAGDEVVQDFEQEKMDTIGEEGDKVVDNTLEGWGSWAGDGVSKKAQKNKRRFLTTEQGVRPEKRKDAKLSRVIINEKRVKKVCSLYLKLHLHLLTFSQNVKYMASQLPHEYETKAQYERSLRMPLGPEWSTKETYQSGTKPRVMIKQGIIKPMEKPMI
jgi:U3 small nucleolar RNA-associated protein 14